MAVYTPISLNELNAHLEQYDLGTTLSFEGIVDGIENTNYLVTTQHGKYILTLFESRIREEDLPFCLGFMEFLHGKGIPAPAVVTNKSGGRVIPLKGRPCVLTTFLNGKGLTDITPPQCALMGDMLARMHEAGRTFPQTRTGTMNPDEWERLIRSCGKKADSLEKGLTQMLQEEIAFLRENHPRDLPRGAVHDDLFPDNIFFQDGKISGVIDFYFACTDFLAYDLMLALNAWCFGRDGAPDKGRMTAFLNAYARGRRMSEDERRALPLFGRMAALRIIATRLYDALHPRAQAIVKTKDPLEHVHILRFHRKMCSSADYGLVG